MTIEKRKINIDPVKYLEVISCKKIFPCIEKIIDFKNKLNHINHVIVIFDRKDDNRYFKMKKSNNALFNRCFYDMDIVRYFKFLVNYFDIKSDLINKMDSNYIKKTKKEINSVCRGSIIEQKWIDLNVNKHDEKNFNELFDDFRNDIPVDWIYFIPDSAFNKYNFLYVEKSFLNKSATTLRPLTMTKTNLYTNESSINNNNKTIIASEIIGFIVETKDNKNNVSDVLKDDLVFIKNYDLNNVTYNLQKKKETFANTSNEIYVNQNFDNIKNDQEINNTYFLDLDLISSKFDLSKPIVNKPNYTESITKGIIETIETDKKDLNKHLINFVSNQQQNITIPTPNSNDNFFNNSELENQINSSRKDNFINTDKISMDATEAMITASIIGSIVFLVGMFCYFICYKFKKGNKVKNNNDDYISKTSIRSRF